jgi:hypothetical protein
MYLYYCFQYYPQQIITLRSAWEYQQAPESSNLTGIVSVVSPFDGYRKGALIARVRMSSDWDITGAADMNLDTRKYTLIVEGMNLDSLLLDFRNHFLEIYMLNILKTFLHTLCVSGPI